MGKKRVLVSYGVDIDAVSGWLGSYGGEDSTSDISRGEFDRVTWEEVFAILIERHRALGWNCRYPTSLKALREVQHQSHVVYSWYELRPRAQDQQLTR
jgi:hypothetical protein